MSRNSPAPRGFRGTSSALRVGQNTFDGRHFTSFARSVQRTELRYPSKGIRSSCEVPFPPTSFSPCGSSDRWQVLRELRVIHCQRFFPRPRAKGEIKNFYPGLCQLSTKEVAKASHTNYLCASFPQREPIFGAQIGRFESPNRTSHARDLELRGRNSFQPTPVGVTPPPSYRSATRMCHHDQRRSSMDLVFRRVHAGPRHHR